MPISFLNNSFSYKLKLASTFQFFFQKLSQLTFFINTAGSRECFPWEPANLPICERWLGEQNIGTERRIL